MPTLEEIQAAAQSGELQRMLSDLGATPEAALEAEGRQRAWDRFGRAYSVAAEQGLGDRMDAIERRVARDAQTHARRELLRLGRTSGASAPMPSGVSLATQWTPADAPAPTPAPEAAPVAPSPTTLTGDTVAREAPLPSWQALLGQQPSRTMSLDAFDRDVASMYAVPGYRTTGGASMGPQSVQEERDLAAEQQGMNALFELSGLGSGRRAGEAFAAGRPVEGVGQLGAAALQAGMLGGSGRLMMGGLGAIGGTAGLDALGVGRAEAQTPNDTAKQQASLAEMRAQRKKAQDTQADLDARAATISAGMSEVATDAAKKAAQTALGVTADGAFGRGSRAAAEAELASIATRRKAAEDAIAQIGPEIAREEVRLRGMERDATTRQAEANVPWWRQAMTIAAPIGGFSAGAALSSFLRNRAAARASAASKSRADERNALLVPDSPDVNARVAGINEFYTRGGGDEPFNIVPTARLGYEAAPQQQSASTLFRNLGSETVGGSDIGRAGISAGGGAFAGWRWQTEQAELARAMDAYQKEPSQANADAVVRARNRLDLAQGGVGMALGGIGGAAVAPFFMRNRLSRPNVQEAGREVMALNKLLRDQPPPTLDVRRTTAGPEGGHWIAPGAPATAGELWASPSGRDLIMRGDDGRYRLYPRTPMGVEAPAGRGKIVPDPREERLGRGWFRLSSAGDGGSGATG